MNKKKVVFIWLIVSLLSWLLGTSGTAQAFDVGPFGVSCYLKNQTYLRAFHGPDDLMQCRSFFNLEVSYDKIPYTDIFVNLRPFYDSVYDWSSEGTGEYGRYLRHGWGHNLGRNNDRDPLLREAFVDYKYRELSCRLGRQIVAWGKSDGVYMLDLINPFCFRNPVEFVEEDTKIPLWMLNLTYGFEPGDLQVLWIWDKYRGTVYPGLNIKEMGYHDWTFNTVGLTNELYAIFDDIFKNDFGIPEGYPVVTRDPAWCFKNHKFGVRWSGNVKGVAYTLNYFYTWSDYTDWPNTGNALTATAMKRNPDRLQIYGFSLDRYFETGKFVLRLEAAYTRGQPFYLPDTNLQERDQIGYMLGYDRWVHTDWLLGLQVWQNFIINPIHAKNAYLGYGADEFDWNTFTVANGLRDPIISNLTFLLAHDGFFMGDTGHLEIFFLDNLNDGYQWLWTKFRYDITDIIQIAIGWNFFWGNEDDLYGQFHDNDNLFFEIKFGWT